MEEDAIPHSGQNLDYPIIINAVVQVEPRTWPGINKPGGIAKVTRCHYKCDDDAVVTHVDVSYIVGRGREKMVPLEYVVPAPQYDDSFQRQQGNQNNGITHDEGAKNRFQRLQLRDRSVLLGRCKLCGSLRSDCGSCDWMEEERRRNLSILDGPISDNRMDILGISSSSDTSSEDGEMINGNPPRMSSSKDFSMSETDSHSSSYASSEGMTSDEEFLSTLHSFASNRLLTARKRARQLANAAKSYSIQHQRLKKERHKKLSKKYRETNKGFKDRMMFLNQLIFASKAAPQASLSRLERSSILENIGENEDLAAESENMINSPAIPFLRRDSAQEDAMDLTHDDDSHNQKMHKKRKVGRVYDHDIGEYEDSDNENDNVNHDVIAFNKFHTTTRSSIEDFQIQDYYDPDSQSRDFIQPEGIADYLPSDVQDLSTRYAFNELPNFFNEIYDKLSNNFLPEATRMYQVLLSNFNGATTRSHTEELLNIENRCRLQYEMLCSKLVRDGTDQCRVALKRFSSRREFRKFRMTNSSHYSKRKWNEQNERLDMRFNDLDKKVEDLLQEFRLLLEQLSCMNGYEEEVDHDFDDEMSKSFDNTNENKKMRSRNRVEPKYDRHSHASLVGESKLDDDIAFKTNRHSKRREKTTVTSRLHHSNRIKSYRSLIPPSNEGTSEKDIKPRRNRYISSNAVSFATSNKHKNSLTDPHVRKERIVNKKYDEDNFDAVFHASESDDEKDEDIKCTLTLGKLLDELSNKRSDNEADCLPETEKTTSIAKCCDNISSMSPSEKSLPFLILLPTLFSNIDFGDDERQHSLLAFKTLLNMIHKHSDFSLQDILQNNPNLFIYQATLLTSMLKLLGMNLGCTLKESDGLIHKLFSSMSKDKILKVITVQIIDVLYAEFRPLLWGSGRALNTSHYTSLCSLRSELGKNTHCVEILSSCLLSSFGSQRWWRSSTIGEHKWFVSSINPKQLDIFWREGIYKDDDSRLMKFGKMCPREEIEALWKLLLWFGTEKSVHSETNTRWRLLVPLFSYQTGVLGQHTAPMSIYNKDFKYPKKELLDKSQEELHCFRILLSAGAFDPLPPEDVIISRLVYLFLSIGSKEKESQTNTRLFSKHISNQDAKVAHRACNETDSFDVFQSDRVDCFFNRLCLEMYDWSYSSSIFSLNTRSSITMEVLNLLISWSTRLTNKKARWIRFFDAIHSACEKLLQDAILIKTENLKLKDDGSASAKGDFFASFFSKPQPVVKHRDEQSTVRYLCESITFVMICVEKLTQQQSLHIDQGVPSLLDISFCKKIWSLLSKQGINIDHPLDSVMEHENSSAFMSLKIFAAVLFHKLHIALQNNTNITTSDEYNLTQDTLSFILSCILACLKNFLSLIIKTQDHLISYSIVAVISQTSSARDLTNVLNYLSCGLLWLSRWLDKIVHSIEKGNNKLILIVNAIHMHAPRFISFTYDCILALSRLNIELESTDTCYRLCLTVVNVLLHLDIVQHRCNYRLSNSTTEPPQETHLYTQRSESLIRESAEKYGLFWDLLIESIQKSRPSVRFVVGNHALNGDFSYLGRSIASRQGLSICSTLVSMCSIIKSDRINANYFLDQIRRMVMVSSIQDVDFLNSIKSCFIAQLTECCKYITNGKAMVERMKTVIFNSYVRTCFSASIIGLFPSSDFETFRKLGGESIESKARSFLKKTAERLESAKNVRNQENIDVETTGLKLRVDSTQTYLVSHFWIWTKNIHFVLFEENVDLETFVQNVCANIVDGLSFVSLERQCMKRIMLMRTVTSKLIKDIHETSASSSIFSVAFITMVEAFHSELRSISRGVSYYEKNEGSTELYEYAKALVLQNSFISMYISLFSWMLSEITIFGSHLTDYASFIFNFIVVPALSGKGIDQSKDMHDSLHKLENPDFDYSGLTFVQEELNKSLTSELQGQILRNLRSTLIYATHSSAVSNAATILFTLMNVINTCNLDSTIQFGPLIHPEVEPESDDQLQNSFNLYFSVVNLPHRQYISAAEEACNSFRVYAIRNFILPKVRHPNVPLSMKLKLLKVLYNILRTKDIPVITLTEGDPKLSSETHVSFDIKFDICATLHAIYCCFQNEYSKDLTHVVDMCFTILLIIMDFRTIGCKELDLIDWCKNNHVFSYLAQYIECHLSIFALVADLWTGPNKIKYQFQLPTFRNASDSDPQEIKALLHYTNTKLKLDEAHFSLSSVDSTPNAYRINAAKPMKDSSVQDMVVINHSDEKKLKLFLDVFQRKMGRLPLEIDTHN